jgi:hypothetical protein
MPFRRFHRPTVEDCPPPPPDTRYSAARNVLTARLIARSHLSRTILVEGGPQLYVVKYDPWGFNSESVLVNGACAARRTGMHNMTCGYRFRLGDWNASLIIAIPWWCEMFPLGDLSCVRLEVEGAMLYEEGRPPKRALHWVGPAAAFPVIQRFDGVAGIPVPDAPVPAGSHES